ncbi:SCO4402 family protein [Denitrobaculum tricleocarpae]|uniref:Uncharacterized protein n=1 Tax=Denitrobaculum tricleocarpae TaxID=2591009 RepID=A0A545TUH0_9PROT|nr:hypothetical protein [Denitrobaculum tricleocarpae]TQV80811.1 hypothetical protein FKG95_11725 [Denitrobaculum tricleocarpae]
MTENTKLKYPNMRDELIDCLEALSDHEYQRAAWVRGELPPGIDFDDMNETLHFLYDDTRLSENSDHYIGVFLRNREETAAVDKLVDAIEAFFQKYNTEMTDGEYIEKPEWQSVLASAKAACELIREQPLEASSSTKENVKP